MNKKIYIEAGANDGVFQSCTHNLEQTGEWSGILVEPNLRSFNDCLKNRSTITNKFYNCALVSFDYSDKYIDFFTHGGHSAMGGVVKRCDTHYTNSIKVECRTLQSILDELNISIVDKFFLDVEGYELSVLKGVNFTKTTFKELEIEVHAKSVTDFRNFEIAKKDIVDYMLGVGYTCTRIIDPGDANIKLILKPIE